jgi:hypothetical protein
LAALFGTIQPITQELLQQIDLDYYRSARLLIVHAELEQLRQERPDSGDIERCRRPRIEEVAADAGLTTRRAAHPAE